MSTIRTLTGRVVGNAIRAKVRAHNSNGWGAYSQLNAAGALVEDLPVKLAAPVFAHASSTKSTIVLTWSALTGDSAGGGAVSITNYVVEWLPPGASSWATHVTTTALTATSTGLSGGQTYQYRVYAQNKYGFGPVSDVLSAVPAEAPAAPAAPLSTQTSVYVKVAWTAPADNFSPIDAYEV